MKQQCVEFERHHSINEKIAELAADGWRVVTISADNYLVYLLCEKEAE